MWLIYWGKNLDGSPFFEQTEAKALRVFAGEHDEPNPDHNDVLKFNTIHDAIKYCGKHYGDVMAADPIHISLARKFYQQWEQR